MKLKVMWFLERYRVFLILLPLVLSGCSPLSSVPEHSNQTVLRGVPFFPENRYWCGPASLAGVMNYYKSDAPDPDTVAGATYSPSAGGTLMADLAWYARKEGFQADISTLNASQLRFYVDRENPIIVFVARSGWLRNYNHFMVVVGYTNRGFIVNSGLRRERHIPQKTFLSLWKRNGRYALLVTPKEGW